MLVSHTHKFIFTKTAKTAGTSVECYFERYVMPSDEWTLAHHRDEYVSVHGIIGCRGPQRSKKTRYWNHMSANLIRRRIGKELWDNYYKFTVVRNPYDRVLSGFYFNRSKKIPAGAFNIHEEKIAFEQWLMHNVTKVIDRNKYILDGKFCLDAVIRYETLHNDMKHVCEQIGVEWDPALLPIFKTGIRPKEATVTKLNI